MLCVVFPLDHKYDVPAVAVNFTESPGQITCAVAGDIAALKDPLRFMITELL